MKFIQGHNRGQTYLFPVSLDQAIDPENEVRLIDLFAEIPFKLNPFKAIIHFEVQLKGFYFVKTKSDDFISVKRIVVQQPTLSSNTHWQVTQAFTQPKPAKEYSCPNTHGQKKLLWVTTNNFSDII